MNTAPAKMLDEDPDFDFQSPEFRLPENAEPILLRVRLPLRVCCRLTPREVEQAFAVLVRRLSHLPF